jgi:hypothetical protein
MKKKALLTKLNLAMLSTAILFSGAAFSQGFSLDDANTESSFQIIDQFPVDLENKVVVGASMSFTFNQQIAVGSFNDENTISLIERDTGKVVLGVSKLIGNDTIQFTPSEELNHQMFYVISVSNELQSQTGEIFAGHSSDFATLFDIGNTTQETINQCGSRSSIRNIGAISALRSGVNARCSLFGFAPVEPVAMSCSLDAVVLDAINTKAGSFNRFTGTLDLSSPFDYEDALIEQGVSGVEFDSIPILAANGPRSLTAFYNRLGGRACGIIMDPEITEAAAVLGSVKGVGRNTFTFYEGIFTKPE